MGPIKGLATGPITEKGRARRGRALALGLPLAALLALGACSSSGGGAYGGAGGSGGGSIGGGTSNGGSSAATTIGSHAGADGTYLTGANGRTVYLWMADTSDHSTCTGACAAAWPPVTTTSKPAASGSATAAMLGTTKRSDGTMQVTYDGHPLYYFSGDSGSGATNGQGSDGFGAKWWLVAPSGSAITGSGSGSTTGGSTSSGSGYNY